MASLDLSTGLFLTVSLSFPGKYETSPVARVLESLTKSGARINGGIFFETDPLQASHEDLDDGTPRIVHYQDGPESWGSSVDQSVLAAISFQLELSSLDVEGRLRTKFHPDPCWMLYLDLPHSSIFEESSLTDEAKMETWRAIETLATDLFDASDCLYGGILFEVDLPTLREVKLASAHLPADFGFYSAALVDRLGRTRILELLKDSPTVRILRNGGIFFAWSPPSAWWSEKKDFVSREFADWVTQAGPRL